MIKIIIISSIGNILEWYEFALFSSFASIIGASFFNPKDSFSALYFGFTMYSAGYIFRIFGNFLFGLIGDKYGRKKALLISFFIMSISTFAIPFIPTYQKIGYISSILIILVRFFQGFSLGGEFSSVVTYTCENAPKNKKGFFSSIEGVCPMIGVALGILTIFITSTYYTEQEIELYAWKIPFFATVLIAIFGFYIRRHATETEEFLEIKRKNNLIKNPFIFFFKNYYIEFFIGFFFILTLSLVNQVFISGIGYATKFVFNISLKNHSFILLITQFFSVLVGILFGIIIDKFSIFKKINKFILIIIFICCILSDICFQSYYNQVNIIGFFLMSVVCGALLGSYPYLLYKLIPANVRETGVGFTLSVPSIIGSFSMPVFIKLFSIFKKNAFHIYFLLILCLFFIYILLFNKITQKQSQSL